MKSSGPFTVAAIVVFAALAGAAVAATEEIPSLHQAWDALTSSVTPLLSSLEGSPVQAPAGDAGTTQGDAGAPVRRQTAPLSSAQLGAPLVHGPFVSACGATSDMKVVVTLAVKMGRASDVSVKTSPPNPVVEGCVERAVKDLRWDVSPNAGHVTVTY
jgi:anti-sigma factor RsiW